MRVHGTLTKWNDDRGFGFIKPARESPDIFVHISAFPRDGVRPRVGELISYELEQGGDGKSRAVRVMRPGQKSVARAPHTREPKPERGSRAGTVLTLLALGGLGAYGYSRYSRETAVARYQASVEEGVAAPQRLAVAAGAPAAATALPRGCDGRTMCSQMTSCAEATYFIRNCPNTQMDGDRDGVPCESQWCN